jgi:hypothetical protein
VSAERTCRVPPNLQYEFEIEQVFPMSVVTIASSGTARDSSQRKRRGCMSSFVEEDHVFSSSSQRAFSAATSAIRFSLRSRSGSVPFSSRKRSAAYCPTSATEKTFGILLIPHFLASLST